MVKNGDVSLLSIRVFIGNMVLMVESAEDLRVMIKKHLEYV